MNRFRSAGRAPDGRAPTRPRTDSAASTSRPVEPLLIRLNKRREPPPAGLPDAAAEPLTAVGPSPLPPAKMNMSNTITIGLAGFFVCYACAASADGVRWDTERIHDRFYTEGGSAGDIDGDGNVDIVSGPLWYKGPEFVQSYEIAPARQLPVKRYSDQFFSSVLDATGDGANDVLVIGFPGAPARLYVNPGHGKLDEHWPMHEITGAVDNESPAVVDLVPGGLPEIVCGQNTQYGYYAAGEDATKPWNWTPVTRPGACGGRFAHGFGVGDVNGDGRLDLLDKMFWWEQPAEGDSRESWTRRQWAPEPYGGGGAQICVADIDGDGDSDIVTSLNAHAYGLAWFEQTRPHQFRRHDIMGQSPSEHPHGVAFSQLHAVAAVDIDGDEAPDIVTGKRYMAHGGKDPGGLEDPVLYWFECVRDGEGVEFVPHLIHRDSGVGVEVLVTDLNADGRPDIVSSSKRGFVVHRQQAGGE